MEKNDKNDIHVSILKPATNRVLRKRTLHYGLYGVSVLLVLSAFIFLIHVIQNKLRPDQSDKLVSTISKLEDGKHDCSQGLKQVGSVGSKLSDSSQYTITARETTLNYLMSCNFVAKDTSRAMIYAGQLNKLYIQDGSKSTQKQIQLAQFIIYMKNYGQ